MRLNGTITAALLLGFTAGCAGGDGSWGGTVTDSAGVTLVANDGRAIWSDASRWTLSEELRFGEVEGDPNYQFGQIGMISVASDGRMFVLDAQALHIKVFDDNGRYIQTLGGPGSGPGELGRGVGFCLMAAGDTVWVPDLMNQRINRWAPDGAVLPSIPLPFSQMLPATFRYTSAGEITYQVRPIPLPNAPAPDSMDTILLFGSDGSIADTLMRFPTGEGFGIRGGAPQFNVWYPEPAWDVTDGLKIVYGVSDNYRFGIYSDGGTPERIVTMPFDAAEVTDRERQVVLDFLREMATDQGAPPERVAQFLSMVNFGEYIPAFSTILSGPRGTVWVQHIQSIGDMTEEELEGFNIQDLGAPDWDVFDADGRYLGVITMPHRFAPRGFANDRIYGVWRDELDVAYVTRLRILGMPGMEG
jgi:hypothetical protein